jgi:YggT family protein
MEVLCRITDPYLNWFRRFPALRTGLFDLSPIVALAVLSVANNVFITLAHYGAIRLGIILAMVLSAIWSAASFILGFFIIVLVLRLIAYLTNRNVYKGFWQIIDTISQPILYRINRFLFRRRLVNYLIGIISSIGVLLGATFITGLIVRIAISFLERVPL